MKSMMEQKQQPAIPPLEDSIQTLTKTTVELIELARSAIKPWFLATQIDSWETYLNDLFSPNNISADRNQTIAQYIAKLSQRNKDATPVSFNKFTAIVIPDEAKLIESVQYAYFVSTVSHTELNMCTYVNLFNLGQDLLIQLTQVKQFFEWYQQLKTLTTTYENHHLNKSKQLQPEEKQELEDHLNTLSSATEVFTQLNDELFEKKRLEILFNCFQLRRNESEKASKEFKDMHTAFEAAKAIKAPTDLPLAQVDKAKRNLETYLGKCDPSRLPKAILPAATLTYPEDCKHNPETLRQFFSAEEKLPLLSEECPINLIELFNYAKSVISTPEKPGATPPTLKFNHSLCLLSFIHFLCLNHARGLGEFYQCLTVENIEKFIFSDDTGKTNYTLTDEKLGKEFNTVNTLFDEWQTRVCTNYFSCGDTDSAYDATKSPQ